jgi:hypothetical protein
VICQRNTNSSNPLYWKILEISKQISQVDTPPQEGKLIMTGKLRILIILVPVIALLLAVVLVPRSAMAGPPAQFPTGTYITTITEADLPPGLPPDVIAVLSGQWQMEFTQAGNHIVTKEGDLAVLGRYTANPARLVFTDLEGPIACSYTGAATGVYQWAFENNELTLTAVHDACGGRHIVLTAHPWQKQP